MDGLTEAQWGRRNLVEKLAADLCIADTDDRQLLAHICDGFDRGVYVDLRSDDTLDLRSARAPAIDDVADYWTVARRSSCSMNLG